MIVLDDKQWYEMTDMKKEETREKGEMNLSIHLVPLFVMKKEEMRTLNWEKERDTERRNVSIE